jgi:prophage DNA circulation protein
VRAVPDDALSVTATAERLNEIAIGQLWRRTALVEMAIAASDIDYSDRLAAIAARADVAELFSREMYSARGAVFRELDRVRGQAAMAISRNIADIRPSVGISATESVPAYVWAYRLYGDAKRGTDLAARNRVQHPGLMPINFEAAAPEEP